MLLGLPMVHLAKVPIARLEHELDYKRVAIIEMSGMVAYYGVGLTMAFRGWKVGAPIAGWWAQFALHLVMAFQTGYRPRLVWDVPLIRRMLRYGTAYSASLWVQQLRTFVNPVIVARFAGATGVGYVALAIRIVEQLGFVRTATARISIAVLARLRGDRVRLARAMSEGMTLQLLSVGPLFIGFGLVAPWVIGRAFGPEWLPVVQIYPLIALAYLFGAMFLLHTSTLTVLERNMAATVFYLAQTAALVVGAVLLVPKFGATGYALAEIATVPVYLLLHALVTRSTESPRYVIPLIWLTAFAIPLLTFDDIRLTFELAWAPLLVPAVRNQVMEIANLVLRRGARDDAASPDIQDPIVLAADDASVRHP
jgi:O-antigen/teichoic acid export membrane protein